MGSIIILNGSPRAPKSNSKCYATIFFKNCKCKTEYHNISNLHFHFSFFLIILNYLYNKFHSLLFHVSFFITSHYLFTGKEFYNSSPYNSFKFIPILFVYSIKLSFLNLHAGHSLQPNIELLSPL